MSMSTDDNTHPNGRRRFSLRSLLLVAVFISPIGQDLAGAILSGETTPSASPREVYPIWRLRMPHLVAKARPRFPKRAKDRGVYEAKVFISAQIDVSGRPRDMQVLHCTKPGFGFEQAAIDAARKWRYEPALLNGEPVGGGDLIIIEFGRESPDT